MAVASTEVGTVRIRPRGYALGAEITGVDASKPLSGAEVAAIEQALDDHLMLYLPGQDLDPKEFRRFCASFGELDTDNIGALNKIPGFTDIIVRSNQPVVFQGVQFKKSSAANRWHSDYSWRKNPSPITFIIGKEMPEIGGDTQFANMFMAFETLSPALQKILEGLEIVNDYPIGAASYAGYSPEEQARDRARNPTWVQPAVRTHPKTGRKSLYIDAFARNFLGMTEEESKPLIAFLQDHSTRYEFTYRHRWTVNDLLMWNNRYVTHYVVQDYDPSAIRKTFRASTVGPDSGYLWTPSSRRRNANPQPLETAALNDKDDSVTVQRSRFLTTGIAAAAAFNITHAPARAAQFVYKLGDPDPVDFPPDTRLIQMTNAVKAESNGRLEIQVFSNSVLGSTTAMLSQMRLGSLQFTRAVNANYSGIVPIAGIDSVGFAFTSAQQPYGALDGPLGAYIRREFAAKGIYVFERALDTGFRQVTSSTKPIRKAEDFVNFKLRTPNAPIFVDLFKTLGASPIPLDSNELYTSLQTHIVNGQEGSYQAVESHRLFEVQQYMSITNHVWGGSWLLANRDAWNALPPDLQTIVNRNMNKYVALERHDLLTMNAPYIDKLKRQGMTFNTADASSMRAQLGAYYARWKREFGNEAWSLLEDKAGKLG